MHRDGSEKTLSHVCHYEHVCAISARVSTDSLYKAMYVRTYVEGCN